MSRLVSCIGGFVNIKTFNNPKQFGCGWVYDLVCLKKD